MRGSEVQRRGEGLSCAGSPSEAEISGGFEIQHTMAGLLREDAKEAFMTAPKGCEVREAENLEGLRLQNEWLPLRLMDDGARGEKVADRLCECSSLGSLGVGLAWVAFEGHRSGLCKAWLWQNVNRFLQKSFCEQLGKKCRSLFPFPNVWKRLEEKLRGSLFDDIFFDSFWGQDDFVDAWTFLSVKFCQQLHGSDLGFREGPLRKEQRACLRTIDRRVRLQLVGDFGHPRWGPTQIKDELASKDIGYGGEEIGKVEKLSLEQIIPSLPTPERGGSIRLEDWLSDSTKELLKDPYKLMIGDTGQTLPKLRGRIHVKEGEKVQVAQLLVARNVCTWRRASETLHYRGQPVRNGLFGVVKPGKMVNQKPILRVIMNLVPTNSLFKIIAGSVHRLPSITQWSTLFIGEGEKVEICQSDITSAFYLFLLPEAWQCILPFNVEIDGSLLGEGYEAGINYVLCAKVLPMGWHSAVGLMEEAAERLLLDSGLSEKSVINRVTKLPKGFTDILPHGEGQAEPFWHIHLDNFACGQRIKGELLSTKGGDLHRQAEGGWNARGVVTAADKSTHRATEALELGAKIHGGNGWLGVESHRLLRVLKLSLWLAFRPNLRKKSLQICLGRWMHVLQFRRAAMSHFAAVWDFLSVTKKRREWQARFELVVACFGGLLFHTDLTSKPSPVVGASDSSMRGGAVGMSTGLTELGRDFLRYEEDADRQGLTIPILVISCFDGIGGCMRSYNVAGARPRLYVSIVRSTSRLVGSQTVGGLRSSKLKTSLKSLMMT